jgi:anti-sigma B factor antagonist
MSYSLKLEGRTVQVSLVEAFDLSLSTGFKEELEQAMSSDIASVRIDASSLDYIDSSGVASLLFAKKLCSRFNSSFAIDQISQPAVRVITLANLDSVLGLSKTTLSCHPKNIVNSPKTETHNSNSPEFSDVDALTIFQNDSSQVFCQESNVIKSEIKPGSFS